MIVILRPRILACWQPYLPVDTYISPLITNLVLFVAENKFEIRIPACQRLRQHSAYVPASLAMAGRSKSETNFQFSKFK